LQQEKNSVNPQVRSGFIWRVSLIAGLGGILYGYDMGIIAAALIFVRSTFNLSTQMQEIVVSVVLVGAMLGAIYGGAIADRIGRRNTLLWAAESSSWVQFLPAFAERRRPNCCAHAAGRCNRIHLRHRASLCL